MSHMYEPEIYIPPVSYKKLYYEKYDEESKNPYDIMNENCKYVLKIAHKLEKDGKYKEAIFYYRESIKLGGNYDMIILDIGSCQRKIEFKTDNLFSFFGP